MNKKVICLVTNWYPTSTNPFNGIFFQEQALALKDHYNFKVVHYRFGHSFIKRHSSVSLCNTYENIEEYQIHLAMPIIPRILRYAKKLIFPGYYGDKTAMGHCLVKAFEKELSDSIDLLYCVSGQAEAGYLNMLSDAYQKPYVVAEHAPFPWPGTTLNPFHKKGLENANLFLAISNDKLRQIMMQNITLPSYVYVGNMVDESQFTYLPSNNQTKTFVMVGAHVFYKNYPLFIQIMTKLKKLTSTPFKLMIVGYAANDGYSKDPDSLEKSINESEIASSVEMIPCVTHNNMPEIYNRADAFVMTSVQEGMPVSALEAGCCGLPIFSTRCGGVEDYVTESIGRIYDIGDSDSFAQGLCDFLEGRITFDSNYIRKSIVGQFGKEAFINNMVSAFHSVTQ